MKLRGRPQISPPKYSGRRGALGNITVRNLHRQAHHLQQQQGEGKTYCYPVQRRRRASGGCRESLFAVGLLVFESSAVSILCIPGDPFVFDLRDESQSADHALESKEKVGSIQRPFCY